MLLVRSWRWWTTLDFKMLSSPDTLHMLLTGFVTVARSMASESICSSRKISWIIWLLYCDQQRLHFSHNKCFFICLYSITAQFKLVKYEFPNLRLKNWPCVIFWPSGGGGKYDITHLSVQLSNYKWSGTLHNVSVHQVPKYYQPQQVPSMAWTTLVMWYMCHVPPI